MNSIDTIVKKLRESRREADYIALKIDQDENGDYCLVCRDRIENEEFEKYIGEIGSPTATKNASLMLRDTSLLLSDDIKKELSDKFIRKDESSDYLSSFNRDVMRAVNDVAPSALHWKNGTKVRNTKTNKEAEFLGYKKDFYGNYQAVFSSGGKEFKYHLADLQNDIKDEVLVAKIEEAATQDGWEYWEMPKDYKGPWTHPQYTKRYSKDLIGFIYPPYKATSKFLKDMDHNDYVAELYDDLEAITIDDKSFSNLEDAAAWLDEVAQDNLSRG